MVSKSRKRLSEKFKRIQVVFCLCFFLIGSFSSFAFASEVSPSQEQEPVDVELAPSQFAVDLELGRIYETASDIKAATATDYSTTDIYNLLYAALRGRSSSSTYSLVAMNSDIRNIYQDLSGFLSPSVGSSPLHALQDIHSVLTGTALGLNPISNIMDSLQIVVGDQSYSQADLTGMIWSLVQDIESNSSISNSYLSSIASAIENHHKIKWSSAGFAYDQTSLTLNGSSLTSQTTARKFYVTWHATSAYYPNTPCVLRLFFPINRHSQILSTSDFVSISNLYSDTSATGSYLATVPDYFIQLTSGGFYVYLFDFKPYTSNRWSFEVVSDVDITYNTSPTPTSYLIPFDTYDYQLIKDSFYQAKAANSLASSSDSTKSLADYFVSPEKQHAENASREVIDDTLDNFTGSGSASIKLRDTSSAKDISNSLKSGLDMGGSSSNALSVFSSANAFWGWFSQDNANYFTLYVPSRSCSSDYSDIIWTDYIPNSLDKINEEVQRELNSK